ncbi:MAG TPA: hypothetical protein VF290_23650 [Pyrinomonadaceae bacterium]
MIDLIRELQEFLSRDPLSLEDVIARVGPVTNDPGGLMPVEFQPSLPGVREASLSRDPDNGLPYLLTIELASDARLTTAELQQAFGDYKRMRTHRDQPPEIMFNPPASGSGWKVALLATLQSASKPLDEQQVTSLSFRREPLSS